MGAGIMGTSTALFLARSGCDVELFDHAAAPMMGASRWNEGKIHLGYLYNADPTLRSATKMLAGGLAFKPLVEQLIGCPIDACMTQHDDIYLVHPESVVSAPQMADYFGRLDSLISGHPDKGGYLADISPSVPLEKAETSRLAAKGLTHGFRVPERSVETNWIADRFVDALAAEPRVTLRSSTQVLGAHPVGDGWSIDGSSETHSGFDMVVNALWEGRLQVDSTIGLRPVGRWTHRYRMSLFIETDEDLDVPSIVLATGPFGDIKNYPGGRSYVSWYPAGLIAEGTELAPPVLPALPDVADMVPQFRNALVKLLPVVEPVFSLARRVVAGGGWVFATGGGSLADPGATLHRRDEFGITEAGTYFSVDTGKYSTAPWLARRLADRVLELAIT
ncbi:MAG: hypothetical protein JWR75_1004 [Devosia sp.]|nr:hypothetical protein [Devosia sp.]